MRSISYSRRNNEFPGDFEIWLRETADDNEERLSRLRRNLRIARSCELTARQQQLLTMYFDEGKRIGQIAEELGIDKSSVSRTLKRAKARLYRHLRYGL